jgi:hypothetical protein
VHQRTYWLDLFTPKTWDEFLSSGGEVSGFRESRWKSVQQIRKGDYLLCYLTGLSRFIGVLEVVRPAFQDSSPIWEQEAFPSRVGVRIIASLTPETAVPVLELKEALSIFDWTKGPSHWTGYVRGSPSRWKASDGEAVVSAITEAVQNPIRRPFKPQKMSYRPKPLPSTKVGTVIVPDKEEQETPTLTTPKEATAHTEVQWLLAKFGNDMGLDVWIARNDRSREVNGKRFTDLSRLKNDLPLQFDEATNRTIELIDVLWVQKHSIVAAFEIESTTQVYSGLLRLSDLISMQPNINIPLFIVAPDERRDKVIAEINRPTFSKLVPPMYEMCRFIPFSTLRDKLSEMGSFLRYLKPDILDELAESCEIEDV